MVGERIYLRPFKSDEAAMVEAWSLQETEVVYPEGRALINAYAYGQFHKSMAETEPPERLRFAIALRETGELIGANGLMDINWINRTAETDTDIFRREHRNAGYGTEAKHLVLEYAFERLGLHAIYAYVAETNARSAAALRKQGYRDAGYAAWESFAPDGLCGGWLFDLLADEWRAARDAVSDPHD
jgi:RimJ/RimL family protein N-acetyltransferase